MAVTVTAVVASAPVSDATVRDGKFHSIYTTYVITLPILLYVRRTFGRRVSWLVSFGLASEAEGTNQRGLRPGKMGFHEENGKRGYCDWVGVRD